MAKIFVSYSRADRQKVKKLIPLLREIHGHKNVWWDEEFVGGQVWWAEILRRIAWCDVFLYVMSPRSVGSPYCKAEYAEAMRIHKPILPVKLQGGDNWVPEKLAQLHYIDLSRQINRASAVPLNRAITDHAARPKTTVLPLSEIPEPLPIVPVNEPRNFLAEYSLQIIIGIIVTIIGGIILAMIIQDARFAPPENPTPTPEIMLTTAVPAVAQENGITLTTAVPAVAQVNDTIPTLSGLQQLQTAEAQLTIAAVTQAVANLTATQNMISNANATGTAAQLALTETAAYATLFALTPSPLELALDRATNFTGTNDDWKALYPNGFVQTFNGVEMVLVPKGFFLMGSDNENLGYKTCFTPYWIGRYEITNLQYGSTGRYTGNNRPREYVTWFEARDFCQSKNSRLPTGAEWEYAARGVSNWVYPWSNRWEANNVVYPRSPNEGTSPVGSILDGKSWIGSLDMSGNVWEWVNALSDENLYSLRGGSWLAFDIPAKSAYRFGTVQNSSYGFRCARDLDA